MIKLIALGSALAASLAAAAPAAAATVLLDFTNAPCATSGLNCILDQTYGDTAGADVSTFTVVSATGQQAAPLNLWKGAGYGDLTDIVYAGSNTSQFKGRVVLTAAAGYRLSLLDFDYASFHGSPEVSPLTITDLAGHAIANLSGQGNSTHGHATINSALGQGIILTWGPDAYNFGVDNIRFDVQRILPAGVPEPTSWALMIVGFGGLGAALRRRRALALA